MGEAANVASLDALLRFKASLHTFGEEARLALSNAESDIQRTIWWLQHEQQAHWQQQIRKRQQLLAMAKSELFRAEMASRDERPSCVVERKAFEKARWRLEEAQTKLQAVHRWARLLDREHMLYRGQTQGLVARLDRDLPVGLARLTTMLDRLQAYVKLAPPPTDADASPGGDRENAAGDQATSETAS